MILNPKRIFARAGSREARNEAAALQILVAAGFDPDYYRGSASGIDFGTLSPVEHFHRHGWKQGFDPTEWFSTKGYLEQNPDVAASQTNPFVHYALHGKREGRGPGKEKLVHHMHSAPSESSVETRPVAASAPRADSGKGEVWSLVASQFDHVFYGRQLSDGVPAGSDAVTHYLELGWREGLDPHPEFSTRQYLADHPDVAVANVNPYFHYLKRGSQERRRAQPSDLRFADGRGDGRSEWRNYTHVRRRGEKARAAAAPRLECLDFTVTLAGLDLAREVLSHGLNSDVKPEGPLVSVVMPCWEEPLVTAECLVSLFARSDEVPLEIVLVDNGSKDPFFKAIDGHPDIVRVNFAENVGFGPGTNAGVAKARGEYVLLLNNDTQVAPGALRAMVDALEADKRAAVVGPKIVSFDGRLQEAGAIIRADGTGQFIGFARDPEEPRFSYSRYVEHLSAAAILVRKAVFENLGGFDDAFAPAYCEDADLSLRIRAAGYRLLYEPEAVVAHHLSKSTDNRGAEALGGGKLQLVNRNRAKLIDRWSNELVNFDIRTIAFYLPQYHPIPENDLWWGKGFTEWRNLTKSRANFVGHRQPRVPADLGYYDLRVPEVMEQQAALARRYGVSGFCYYYYRFGDKRLLEQPLERMLETGKPDFPFCLCWANENWSRRWDGDDQDILMEQKYGEKDAIGFAEDVARYFASKNYITVEGKPLILLYRLQEIPNPKRYVAVCRNVWKRLGFPEVMVAMVESFELSASPKPPQNFGADVTVEFPAHGMVQDPPMPVKRTNTEWTGNAHDYRELAGAFMSRAEAGFKRFRSVLVGWDTTPRHPTRSFVLQHATPGAFQAWLEWTYQRTREQNYGEERLVFVNAWNEWCEGSYLEPDADYGHAHLQAVRNAQETVVLGENSFVEIV